MMNVRSFKQKVEKVLRHWRQEEYDVALRGVEVLLKSWPGNAYLYILWASLVQLQEEPSHSLEEAKTALERAVEVDKSSPAGAIELGYFLDAVEDNPNAAAKAFASGTFAARRLLIEGLAGQAKTLLQLNKREEAFRCLTEALYLANVHNSRGAEESANGAPDVLLRDATGHLLALQVKGPFAATMDDLLKEFSGQSEMNRNAHRAGAATSKGMDVQTEKV